MTAGGTPSSAPEGAPAAPAPAGASSAPAPAGASSAPAPAGATLRVEIARPGVAVLTLDRPEALNALSWALIDELHATLATIRADRAIRVLVLTGAGRGFCSGLDIKIPDPFGQHDDGAQVMDRQVRIAALATALRELPQPVIAAVNGVAAGGGLALALASDVRLGSAAARFNVAFVRVGLSGCDVGVSYLLPRIVGLGHASELMLTGRLIDAPEALRIGLLNRVVEGDALLPAALDLAEEICANAPFGVRMTKEVLARNVDAPSLQAAIDLENRTQVMAGQTADGAEALAAFRERRPASFA